MIDDWLGSQTPQRESATNQAGRLLRQIGHACRIAARRVGIRSLLAFLLPLGLFGWTLAPTIYNLDSAELTTAAATGGLMRATGYPLYLVLGQVWALLPIGDVGYRFNLFSAVAGALTIALADRVLQRWAVPAWAAFGALGLLATGVQFWALSSIAEVYTLHTALMMGWVLALLSWSERPDPGRAALVGLLTGLSLSHHAAAVLLIPGGVVVVIWTWIRERAVLRGLPAAGLGLLVGLSPYLLLPLRFWQQPVFNYAGVFDAWGVFHPVDLSTPAGLWWLVTGRAFAGQMLAYGPDELPGEALAFGGLLVRAFFAVGIGPGIWGVVALWRRSPQAGAMTALIFAANAVFYINYRVIDKDTMFLPVFVVWAVWLAIGYDRLGRWLTVHTAGVAHAWVGRVWAGAVLVAVLVAGGWNLPLANLSTDRSARDRGEGILRSTDSDALIFGWWDTAPVIQYLQLVEGQRADVDVVNRFLIAPEDMRRWIVREAGRRPVYIDAPLADLPETLEQVPVGLVYRVRPANGP